MFFLIFLFIYLTNFNKLNSKKIILVLQTFNFKLLNSLLLQLNPHHYIIQICLFLKNLFNKYYVCFLLKIKCLKPSIHKCVYLLQLMNTNYVIEHTINYLHILKFILKIKLIKIYLQ